MKKKLYFENENESVIKLIKNLSLGFKATELCQPNEVYFLQNSHEKGGESFQPSSRSKRSQVSNRELKGESA